MESSFSLADDILAVGDSSATWLESSNSSIVLILLAAFGIAVGFVAYKLIKRALNKA